MGMTGAWVYVRLRSAGDRGLLQRRAALVAGGAATLLAVCAYLIGRAGSVGGSPLAALGYTASLGTAMVALALARARVQRVFANPLARRLGDISYGIFLAHVPIIWFATTQMSLPGGGGLAATATWAAIVFPSSIVYGYLSARFVEQPVRRWAHRFGRRAQASARPAPAGARG